jgi:hypothetical protein
MNKIKFEQELVLSNSYSSKNIGKHINEMELIIHSHGKSGCIIWNYWPENDEDDMDETVIGLWFNGNKELEDYDGVYELPKEAIQLLKDNGYGFDENMRETYPDEDDEYEKELREVDDDKTLKRCQD